MENRGCRESPLSLDKLTPPEVTVFLYKTYLKADTGLRLFFPGRFAMKFCALALLMILFAMPVFAADVDGKWTGTVSTGGGDFPVALTFKADGTKLTGTSTGPD